MLKLLMLAALIWGTFMLFRKNRAVTGTSEETAVEMERDPVCGAYVDAETAHKVKLYDDLYYFCSIECRDTFIAEKKGETE